MVDADRLGLVASHLGHLHRLALGKTDPFPKPVVRRRDAEWFLGLVPRIEQLLEAIGVGLPSGYRREHEQVGAFLSDPGSGLTFTVGDMAPSNVALTPSMEPVLIDMEYAGFRHAFYDRLFWISIVPYPKAWRDRADAAYLEAFGEEDIEALAVMAAHHFFFALTWQFGGLWDADREWAPGVSARAIYRHKAMAFLQRAEAADCLDVMRRVAERFLEATADWPTIDEDKGVW